MAENEIEEMLEHLRRIKSGGDLDWFGILQIEEVEMVLRVFRTFTKYHDVLLPDSLVELTKRAKLIGEILHRVLGSIPHKCKTNLNLERLESHLLEFFQGNTASLSHNYELNDFDLSKYMDCLENFLNDLLMMFLQKGNFIHSREQLAKHRSIKELKIVQKKIRFLKYIYATEINGYVDYEKLECLETRIQFMTNTVGQYCLAVLDYVTEGKLNEENDNLDVVPIVGMGGQGKTTIARKLYNNDIIVSRFDVRAWCIISQTYNRRELLQDIFSQVTGSDDNGATVDVLADMLRRKLMGKRYLIVLDDMWDCMVWDDLRLSFPDDGIRSRIVVTTRLEEVGKQVKYHTDPYSLPFLTTEESCQLLQKKVFQKEDCPPELQDVSQAVAKKCKGLPLVVVLVAGIIKKRKMEESWWNEVKDALFDYLDSEFEEYSLATMQLSFDNLPHCLKPCLLYMGMFSEDARIPASTLISLWIAEGFVENTESGRLMEEEAEGYLMDLISSNLVMLSKRSYKGRVKYCQVHDVVHHFCLEKSREAKFMLAVKGQYIHFQPSDWKGTRVSFSFSEELSKFASLVSKTQKPFHQHLRSLITTNRAKSINDIFSCQISELRLLKVLDLSSYIVEFLSLSTFKPLNQLKYLAVQAFEFYFDPGSHLPHIETFIVMNLPYYDILLPVSFWEMKKLRHAHFGKAEFDKQGLSEGSSKLENLRILKNIVGFDRVDVLSRRCPNLQQLQITYFGNNEEPFCPKLENLTQLQQLQLSFARPRTLSGLQLPSNLNKLVLEGIHIGCVIPFIAGLPSLEYLQLHDVCFPQSEEWCLGDITFHKLKLLKLVKLNISRWDVSEESFPLLETLVIKKCIDLEEIPLSFADIPTLEQIKLIGSWKVSLEDSAVRMKEEIKDTEGCDRLHLVKQRSD